MVTRGGRLRNNLFVGRRFLSFLAPDLILEKSPACGSGLHCQTGRSGDTFLELMASSDGVVKYVTITAPLLNTLVTEPSNLSDYSSSQAAVIFHKIAAHKVFSAHWPRDLTLEKIMMNLTSCGVLGHRSVW